MRSNNATTTNILILERIVCLAIRLLSHLVIENGPQVQYSLNLIIFTIFTPCWSHGVMVSTLDSESSDPSSNLGGTCTFEIFFLLH